MIYFCRAWRATFPKLTSLLAASEKLPYLQADGWPVFWSVSLGLSGSGSFLLSSLSCCPGGLPSLTAVSWHRMLESQWYRVIEEGCGTPVALNRFSCCLWPAVAGWGQDSCSALKWAASYESRVCLHCWSHALANGTLGAILGSGRMLGAEKRKAGMRCLCFPFQQGHAISFPKQWADFPVHQPHTPHYVARKPFYPLACF